MTEQSGINFVHDAGQVHNRSLPEIMDSGAAFWISTRMAGSIFFSSQNGGWVAGVELATASEPPARRPRIWGRRPSGVDPSHPEP